MIYYKISPSLEPNNGSLSKGEKRGKKEKKGERRRKKGGKWGKMRTNGENTVKNARQIPQNSGKKDFSG